jgi:uncharacterized protein YutE (UPF0331/DUF86 family)
MNPLLPKIRDYFSNHIEVVAVYIFGSFAIGKERTHSDMVKAIGFRNLIVHEYAKLDLRQVLQTAKTDIVNLSKFLKEIFQKTNITQ